MVTSFNLTHSDEMTLVNETARVATVNKQGNDTIN